MKRRRNRLSERGETRLVQGLCVFCMKSFAKDISENYFPNFKKSLLLKNRRGMKYLCSKLEIEEPLPFGFNFVSECIPLCPACRRDFDQLHQLLLKLQAIQMQLSLQVDGIRRTVVTSPSHQNSQILMEETHFNLFRRLVKQKAKEKDECGGGSKIPELQVKLSRLAPQDIHVRKQGTFSEEDAAEEGIEGGQKVVKTEIETDGFDFEEEMGFFTVKGFDSESDEEEDPESKRALLPSRPIQNEEGGSGLQVFRKGVPHGQEMSSTGMPTSCSLSEGTQGSRTSFVHELSPFPTTCTQEDLSKSSEVTGGEHEGTSVSKDPVYEPPASPFMCDSSEGSQDDEYYSSGGGSSSSHSHSPGRKKGGSQWNKCRKSKGNKKGSKNVPLGSAAKSVNAEGATTPTEEEGDAPQSGRGPPVVVVAPEITLEPIIEPLRPRKKWSSHGLGKDANDCQLCGKNNNSEKALISHYKNDHPGEKVIQFKCPQCDHIGSSRPQLRRHLMRRHGPPEEYEKYKRYKCTLCSKKFPDRKGLTHHFKIHTGVKEFSCPQCAKSFRHKLNLEVHVRNVHGSVRLFACTLCPKKFKQKHTLEYHLGAHQGEKKFPCHICGSRRASKKGLEKHFEDHKTKTKDWVEPPNGNKDPGFRKWRIKQSVPTTNNTEQDEGGGIPQHPFILPHSVISL